MHYNRAATRGVSVNEQAFVEIQHFNVTDVKVQKFNGILPDRNNKENFGWKTDLAPNTDLVSKAWNTTKATDKTSQNTFPASTECYESPLN